MEDQEFELEPAKRFKNGHWYKRVLNNICMDERITPNRRLLAAIIGMYIDADTREDKQLAQAILLGGFVNKSGLQIYDRADVKNGPNPQTKVEMQAAKQVNTIFSSVLADIDLGEDDDAQS